MSADVRHSARPFFADCETEMNEPRHKAPAHIIGRAGIENIPIDVGDVTLVLGIPETDPLPENAPGTHIGPILWQNPDAKLPDALAELSQELPTVWLYLGNPQYGSQPGWADSAVVLRACVEALGQEEIQVVVSTGYHLLPDEFLPLPDHFHFEPFVPGLSMAEQSDLLIHHGGYGSCQTGLYTGTPAVIIPTYSERESNARALG